MSRYILINRIEVQNANAVAGFTWGFPAITHFLGFVHNLSIKLKKTEFNYISLSGCAVISHEHRSHTYGEYEVLFSQTKNPGAMEFERSKAGKNPSIIEEGKMGMTISLVIGYEGFSGREDDFCQWIKKQCMLQRLAGGTILSIGNIQLFDVEEMNKLLLLKQKLLPGFVLLDRSDYLSKHHDNCMDNDVSAEVLDAWMDFSALKQQARPKSDLISKHLKKLVKNNSDDSYSELLSEWDKHLSQPYDDVSSSALREYFNQLDESKSNKALLDQWQQYLQPTDKTPADWEYLPKPSQGYLVPIMTGYKAIAPLYDNSDVANTRDSKTPVRFVEPVHSVGEWRGINRLRSATDFAACLWYYGIYEDNWYLCQQDKNSTDFDDKSIAEEIAVLVESDDDF